MYPLKDDAVKTDVFEVDISGELLHKRVLHGQGPFGVHSIGFFFAEFPYRTAREKSIMMLSGTRGWRCNKTAIERQNLSQLYPGIAPAIPNHRTSTPLSRAAFEL
jgi:hypothetical protein